eukprot:gnl/MRDRNA2_/MRDRNA2_67499_c0_seq1.p1 gnl/MRDRNA2_/MRDRNA2_67499_c0~~gnl/MRDRNA2_/MRDRNA2_67499_c0_seq1.p1  ORF type:complete len:248 (+),score=36.72 gnl/MRDRNA2_/MRDRNA2_67499_c0_seq1:115-858(+)
MATINFGGSLEEAVTKARKRKADQSASQSSNGNAANGGKNTGGGGSSGDNVTILLDNCRLSLQHESHLRGSDQDQNLKLVWPRDHPIESAMISYKEEYAGLNVSLRKEVKDKFKGHTHGVKPQAYFRCLIVQLSRYVNSNLCSKCPMVMDTDEVDYEKISEALQVIHARATAYTKDPRSTQVTRCYGIHNATEAENECSKWISCAGSDPELMEAFPIIKERGCLKPTNIQCYQDTSSKKCRKKGPML